MPLAPPAPSGTGSLGPGPRRNPTVQPAQWIQLVEWCSSTYHNFKAFSANIMLKTRCCVYCKSASAVFFAATVAWQAPQALLLSLPQSRAALHATIIENYTTSFA